MMDFISMLKNRRSVYSLDKTLPVAENAVADFVRVAVQYVPDAFNMKSQRVVLVMGARHEEFWNAVYDEMVKFTGGRFSRDKIDSFAAAYGTVLYFYDTAAVEETRRAYPGYAENFHDWVMQSNAMLQFAIWVGFADMNIGANLQHYNPVIDNMVREMFELPDAWTLVAQMPFGGIAAAPKPKPDTDMAGRVKVVG